MEDPCKDAPEDSLVIFRKNPKNVYPRGQILSTPPTGRGNKILNSNTDNERVATRLILGQH